MERATFICELHPYFNNTGYTLAITRYISLHYMYMDGAITHSLPLCMSVFLFVQMRTAPYTRWLFGHQL